MDHLPLDVRRVFERAVLAANEIAVEGAEAALRKWAVGEKENFPHFTEKHRGFRKRLRARGRELGDVRQPDGWQGIARATQQLAYEYWHRMLFARFLAANGLLMHPDGVAVSLEECEELAPQAQPPAADGIVLAARYASRMLPQIFPDPLAPDADVLLEVEFAPEHRIALERILNALPHEVFQRSESLGWAYQFWQSRRKDEINRSGVKIDGSTIAPVTQLFTETYMVEFLLHNTIGAWWVARNPGKTPPVTLTFLRRLADGTPAAGPYPGWPATLKNFTLLDPCCGSYHFLVTAFRLLVPLRVQDEGISVLEAVKAVLRENLHGLDIDPCCSKMAAFSLAFVAWRYPDEEGNPLGPIDIPELNTLNIACSGQAIQADQREEWLKLANGNRLLRQQIEELVEICKNSYHIGSLIDLAHGDGELFRWSADILSGVAAKLANAELDPELRAVGVSAQGLARAVDLLSRKYTLVCTNVPYLGRGKQGEEIKSYLDKHYAIAKADLATAFVLRCLQLCAAGGSTALVTPQNWLFLTSYEKLREELLKRRKWNLVARLGPRAFETISGEVVNVALMTISAVKPADDHRMAGLDVSEARTPIDKADRLADRVPTPVQVVEQAVQLKNPDACILTTPLPTQILLSQYAESCHGISTTDYAQFGRVFWELASLDSDWLPQQSTVESTCLYGGREHILLWEQGKGRLQALREKGVPIVITGLEAWRRRGIAVSQMNELPVTVYDGNCFDDNTGVIVPKNGEHHLAIWAFCSSPDYSRLLRIIDQSIKVTYPTLVKVPFDLARWQAVAAEKYPNGLPEPYSDDPTQWLFKGDIRTSTSPLQVAVARLLGYRWPDQPKEDPAVDPFVDDDGIVCIPALRTEAPAAERLRELLRACYGQAWSDAILTGLLTNAGGKAGDTLEDWLRNKFFDQHCKLFHQRPFVWHVWDGRKDGFSALVNYHTLTHKTLENLTFSYLGDWITAQAADAKATKTGADLRLKAAQDLQEKLKLILAGEPDYDIFVRWKPLSEQSIGWNPDLNDGVRMNIRPFVEAGILRKNPNIKWTKDRGNEPTRDKDEYPWFWSGTTFTGDRVNDKHYTTAEKIAARKQQKGAS